MTRKIAFYLITILLLASCSPINRFTRLKKTPREYSLNYCGEPIIAPRTYFNKEVWIVFSDRENNVSYQNPTGKVKFKNVEFLQPFFVIKEKGDYLCLVKYDPEIIENNLLNGKFKDRKKAEYYGWIHKDNLLLTKQSVTDITTGFKNKQVSIVTDTTSIVNQKVFFNNDSIRTFRDPNLTVDNGKIPFSEILYTLKLSPNRQSTLVAKKTIVSPDSFNVDILGWVSASLVKDVGQRLHVNLNALPDEFKVFMSKDKLDTLHIPEWTKEESNSISRKHQALKYSPVIRYSFNDSIVNFKTGIPVPIIDQRDNYVFNVNGNKITYGRFKELEKELHKLNLLFVFEGRERVLETYPSIVSAIQSLQPLFEENDDIYSYKFGAVVGYQGNTPESSPIIKSVGLTSDYTEVIDYLISEADNTAKQKPLATKDTWSGVRKAVDMIEPFSSETNLLVVIGETGYSEWADSLLVDRAANANCRILGYQMNSVEENVGNNFVLQIVNMITHYANKKTISKREMIVSVDQLVPQNRFRESSKNVYALDFPDKSMTQGWVVFPEKKVEMPLYLLTSGVDSLITEIKWDNDNLISSLYKAFNSVGNYHYKYDSLFLAQNSWDSTKVVNRDIQRIFPNQFPVWHLPAEKVIIPDSISEQLRYHILLSSDELNLLMNFFTDLSANEVDYKYIGTKKKKAKKKCNCPDDDESEVFEIELDSTTGVPEYENTKQIRNQLHNLYIDELGNCQQCRSNKHKQITLADAHFYITGCPTYNPILRQYTVRDIKKKKILKDKELDELILLFKQKKEALSFYLANPETFTSNGETYFWISQELLP